ncbi:2-iminobutanoate/2-iminopropanoate deaminase-like [Tupaia chinensis]|uniref:2-iminobutanoate/2-iminopropanoate deaminase-like n=1 Tax=Tupaia chinensis TaxID=246437 RepID=UPI0003C906B0|nr:2-iminobutanoate/2-iminopropanoate deaminase-like [Tupaia chinensis]
MSSANEQKSCVRTTSPGGGSKRELATSSLIRKVISTAKARGAIGPYSQAVVVDRTVYVSGQLGINPSSGQLVPGGVAEEAKQALLNMGEILKVAGCDCCNVVKTTVLLADINDFGTVNEICKQYFKNSFPGNQHFPARTAYQVAALPKGGQVEIEAVAIQGPLTTT